MKVSLIAGAVAGFLVTAQPAHAATPAPVSAIDLSLRPTVAQVPPRPTTAAPDGPLKWQGSLESRTGTWFASFGTELTLGVGGFFAIAYLGLVVPGEQCPTLQGTPNCVGTLMGLNLTVMTVPSVLSALVVHELTRANARRPSYTKLLAWSLLARAPFVVASTAFLARAVGSFQWASWLGLALLFDGLSFMAGPIAEVIAADLLPDEPSGAVGPVTGGGGAAVERPAAVLRTESPAGLGELRIPLMALSF